MTSSSSVAQAQMILCFETLATVGDSSDLVEMVELAHFPVQLSCSWESLPV